MSARSRITRAFALIAAAAVVAVAAAGYGIGAGLLDSAEEERRLDYSAEQTFRAIVDATATFVQAGASSFENFGKGPATAGSTAVDSPDVITQVLRGDGSVYQYESDRTRLPVYTTDQELARRLAAGDRAERLVGVGDQKLRLITVSFGGTRGAVQIARPIIDGDDPFGALAWRLGGAAVVVVLLAVLAARFAARRLTRGLERLAETAEEVAAGGRLDVLMSTGGTDEVARLGAAFDSVLVRLAAAREDQRRLVQDANHELRTPLTSLRTNVSVLKRMDELSPESRGQLIEDLDGETRELSHLVAELMEFSSERRIDEEYGAVDLLDLADRVATRARRRSGREVLVNAEGVVTGRARGLERALVNLVDNALKFAPDGPVDLVLRPTGFRVLDRGPGLAPEDTARIFDRFYRSTAARSLPGSGLGLAIVHEVATTHGGAVFARTRPGGGAEIGFTL
ncbi:MAG: HAMP domain-containing sensor histidine kinase [Umezawaea sp.]